MSRHSLPFVTIVIALALSPFGDASGQSLTPPGPAPGPVPAPAQVAPSPALPQAPIQSAPPAGARTAPAGLAPSTLGPLELTPLRAVLRNVQQGAYLCVEPTFRFRLRNTGQADVRVAVLASSINVTDDLGLTLLAPERRGLYVPSVIGVTALKDAMEWNRAAGSAGSQITTLAPGQTISIQFVQATRGSGTHYCVNDTAGNFARSYRPSSVTISATLATIDLSGSADLRPFSMFDVPVDLLRL